MGRTDFKTSPLLFRVRSKAIAGAMAILPEIKNEKQDESSTAKAI
jgi:hypothetical protein